MSRQVPPQTGSNDRRRAAAQCRCDSRRRRRAAHQPPEFRLGDHRGELKQVRNNRLFEIFNGHPQVNNVGGGGVPGMEEAWDTILSSGMLLYGIAVDDAHTFKQPGNPDGRRTRPGLGLGARAASRCAGAAGGAGARRLLCVHRRRADGRHRDGASVSVIGGADLSSWKYRIQFIGPRAGPERSRRASAALHFAGGEGYVRAKIIESNGPAGLDPACPGAALTRGFRLLGGTRSLAWLPPSGG